MPKALVPYFDRYRSFLFHHLNLSSVEPNDQFAACGGTQCAIHPEAITAFSITEIKL
jgi:hypothetical protein